MSSNVIDLSVEAAKREIRFPDGIIVKFGDDEFRLPAELPVVALDPIFEIDVDLAAVFAQAIRIANDRSDASASEVGAGVVVDLLLNSPNLPRDVWGALRKSLAVLFGPEQWERFDSLNLSLPTYIALVREVAKMYGTTLGEAFGSAGPSETGGLTSSETSDSSIKSTRGTSGGTRKKPRSLESAAS